MTIRVKTAAVAACTIVRTWREKGGGSGQYVQGWGASQRRLQCGASWWGTRGTSARARDERVEGPSRGGRRASTAGLGRELGQSQVCNARVGIIRGVVCLPSSAVWCGLGGRVSVCLPVYLGRDRESGERDRAWVIGAWASRDATPILDHVADTVCAGRGGGKAKAGLALCSGVACLRCCCCCEGESVMSCSDQSRCVVAKGKWRRPSSVGSRLGVCEVFASVSPVPVFHGSWR